jgi:hypothetical protein
MSQDSPRRVSRLQPGNTEYPLTTTFWGSDIDVYQVLGSDLKRIKESATSSGLYLTFFGIAIGAVVSFGLVLATVEITDPRYFGAFVALFALSVGAAAFLGIKARIDYRETRHGLNAIKDRSRKLGTVQGAFMPLPPASESDTQGLMRQ